MGNLFEYLSVIANLATAIAVIVAAWQLFLAHRQSVMSFEDSFAKEYREIMSKLPTKALLGEPLTNAEYANHFDEMYHYIDLCNEQAFLKQSGRISNKTWVFWQEGIALNMKRPAFERAWSEIAYRSNGDFSELRQISPPHEYLPLSSMETHNVSSSKYKKHVFRSHKELRRLR